LGRKKGKRTGEQERGGTPYLENGIKSKGLRKGKREGNRGGRGKASGSSEA